MGDVIRLDTIKKNGRQAGAEAKRLDAVVKELLTGIGREMETKTDACLVVMTAMIGGHYETSSVCFVSERMQLQEKDGTVAQMSNDFFARTIGAAGLALMIDTIDKGGLVAETEAGDHDQV